MEKVSLTNALILEIQEAIARNQGNLGKAFRAQQEGATTARQLVEQGAAANLGAAGNLQAVLRALVDHKLPKYPSRAAQTGRSIGGLLRDNPDLSLDAKNHLLNLRAELDSIINDEIANLQESKEFEKISDALIADVEKLGGVYVYTFPTYLKVPVKTDPERFWFKIGMTQRVVDLRIADQTRATAMPEDPWVLRVYRSSARSNVDIERQFHKMLDAAGHARTEAKRGGREWFATNLEFLDELAQLLELEIEQDSNSEL